jgi:DnaJ like chaperone protein
MDSRFFGVRGTRSTTKEFDDAVSAAEPNRPRQNWQFVNEFQTRMGEDSEPDPQFFVESWTLGVSAAMENLQKRRQVQAARARHSHSMRQVQDLGTLASILERELGAEFHSSVSMGQNEEYQVASQPLLSAEEPEWDPLVEECESAQEASQPMTRERACRLLEVAANSTRPQIKAAYRRKVSQWHPDRLAHRGEDLRLLANRQMAAINEAYRFLRD